jgi:hypothetical protein
MFNVEPQEKSTAEDIAEFEKHVATRHKETGRAALWAGGVFLLLSLPILFSDTHALNHYWEASKQFILIAWMASLLWLVLKVGAVWASWQSARETRREFRDRS